MKNTPIDPTRCPICGAPNDCHLAAGATSNAQCWCSTKQFPRELLVRVPKHARHRACICRHCWTEAVAVNNNSLVSVFPNLRLATLDTAEVELDCQIAPTRTGCFSKP